jgi:cell division protein FtsI/penicillin-binding protein 2
VALLLALSILAIRLYFVQIVYMDDYRSRAEGQATGSGAKTENRGNIYFTSKDGELVAAAVMQTGYKLAIQPKTIKDAEGLYATLAPHAKTMDKERFFKSARKTDDPYEDVAFRLTEEEATAIRELNLTGVVLTKERWRNYPRDKSAAHVIGFVGYRGDERVGRSGLEYAWEHTLRREPRNPYASFFSDIFSNTVEPLVAEDTETEGDIVTSIEPMVTQRLQETVERINKEHPSRLVGGIVMNPATGAILAIEATPSYDPNRFNEVSDPRVFVNPLVENVYELGSIVKPLTVAMGIDAGVITPQTTYNDTGCIERSGARVCNYDHRARGVVPMQEVLNQSLNTGVAFIAEKLGRERFRSYATLFGLHEGSDVDLPNEGDGMLSAIEGVSDVDLASASFGQGFAITPMVMIRALSALAHGGETVTPHVVEYVRLPTGIKRYVSEPRFVRAISPEAARTTTDMLTTVVDTALVQGKLKQEHYAIAAKTGTAQIAQPHGGYYDDRYLHSFFGYFPAHQPRFLVFLFAVEPTGAPYASQTLSEPFMDFAKFLINYYEIPPDR